MSATAVGYPLERWREAIASGYAGSPALVSTFRNRFVSVRLGWNNVMWPDRTPLKVANVPLRDIKSIT